MNLLTNGLIKKSIKIHPVFDVKMKFNAIKYLVTDIAGGNLFLEERFEDSWAITDGYKSCLNKHFFFEYEGSPSTRSEEFLERCRFTFDEAIIHLGKFEKINKEKYEKNINV